jgi:hypothetical protein
MHMFFKLLTELVRKINLCKCGKEYKEEVTQKLGIEISI